MARQVQHDLGDQQAGYAAAKASRSISWGPTGGTLSVTQAGSVVDNKNYLTDVGAFSGSGSFYGAFDQSGNVWQWTDGDGTTGEDRMQRGGSYTSGSPAGVSSSESRSSRSAGKSLETPEIGFRLAARAAVPEPSTSCMALAGLACGGYSLFRRRKRA